MTVKQEQSWITLPCLLKKGIFPGIKDTFLAASSEVAGIRLDIESEELSNLQDYSVKDDDKVSLGKLLGIIIFIIIIFLLPRKPRRRYYRRGPFNGPFFGPFGGGGGFGGGGFGGFGGGGFGGGRSGGGGASR